MVVVIIGVIAAIAVPRLGAGAGRARERTARTNEAALQRAVDLYMAEHEGRSPAEPTGGSGFSDAELFALRLMMPTSVTGEVEAAGEFGPYLSVWPRNPMSRCQATRIDGAATPQGCAWWYESARSRVRADHAGAFCPDSGHASTVLEAVATLPSGSLSSVVLGGVDAEVSAFGVMGD